MSNNIFDEAAKKPKKPEEDKPSGAPVSKRTTPRPDVTSLEKLSNSEITAMLDKIRTMRKDLEEKLGSVRSSGQAAKIDLERYFGNTLDLTKSEIEAIQAQEKILTDKLAKAIPPESCVKKNPKSKEKLTKERKSKFRGARQKWIPMK